MIISYFVGKQWYPMQCASTVGFYGDEYRTFTVHTDDGTFQFNTQKEAENYLDRYYHNKNFHNKLENIINEKEQT